MLRRIKPTLKLPGSQEAQPFMRTLVLVLENPLVDYLLHLSRTHRLVVVVKALGLQRAYEPLYERLSRFIETLKRVYYIEFVDIKKGKKV